MIPSKEASVSASGFAESAPAAPTPAAATHESQRVYHMEGFEPSFPVPESQADEYARRFVTLFRENGVPREGGFANVVRVSNLWGEVLALKILKNDRPMTERRAEAFRRECELQRAVSGLKGFPCVYGFGLIDGVPALVMEWIEGVTLAKAARILSVDDEGRVSPFAVACIGRDLLDLIVRLGYVEGGLAHRDISLANVLIRTDRSALSDQEDAGTFDLCLIDFGSASRTSAAYAVVAEEEAPSGDKALEPLAVPRPANGATLEFAAPEALVQNGRVTAAADVYAAASVLWWLATGSAPYSIGAHAGIEAVRRMKRHDPCRPWAAAHDVEDVTAVLVREPEAAAALRIASADMTSQVAPDQAARALRQVDGQLGDLLRACLSPDPAARPEAPRVRDALEAFSSRYRDNVGRALRGEPLAALAPGISSDGFGGAVQRRRTVVRVAGKSVAGALALIVVAVGALLCAWGDASPFARLPLVTGPAAGAIAAACLALPVAAEFASRWRRRGMEGFLRGAAGAAAGCAVSLVLGIALRPEPLTLAAALGAALAVTTAAGWLALSLDFAAPAPENGERKGEDA